MKVLHVIDGLGPGGSERSLVEITPHLIRLGCQVDVAVLYPGRALEAELQQSGAGLHHLPARVARAGWIQQVRCLVKELHPTVVHTTLFNSDVVGRIAAFSTRTPVVSTLAIGYEDRRRSEPEPGLHRWRLHAATVADAATARLVTRFHALSQSVADLMTEWLHLPRNRIDVIPRGRDPERLGRRTTARRAAARHRLAVDGDDLVLVALSRHEHQKGLDVLLQALPLVARQRRVRLFVAGIEGRATPQLHALVEALDLHDQVRLLGARQDVPELLCAADIFVLPSRWEGLPGALLEAMALEVPIVASDLATVREVVPDGSYARLVPPETPDNLAGAILACARQTSVTVEQTRAARRRFLELYSIDSVAAQMYAFYRRVCAPGAT